MSPSPDSSTRIAPGRKLIGALARLLPGLVRFRWLGLPAKNVWGDPARIASGYRVEPSAKGAVHHLHHGVAWARGAHFDAQYRLLHALSPGINRGMDYWMLKRQCFFPRLNPLPDETVSLIADGNENYYHWMFDVLPRLAALEPERIPSYHYLVSQQHPFQRQTLDLLQIPETSRIPATALEFYTAVDLQVPLAPTGVSPDNVSFLRQLLLEHSPRSETTGFSHERIYISRRQAHSRRVLNEEALYPLLEKYGFRICHTEQLSLQEQMLLFQGASIILGPHGAAWTNLIFAQPGALALEILPEGLETAHVDSYHLYERLAEATGIRHRRIIAASARADLPHGSDMQLDPRSLAAVLRELE